MSIKTETGKATRPSKISITKLCTTETGHWTAEDLVAHAIAHMNRHDRMLMLRAVWREGYFDYQLVEIPLGLLARMKEIELSQVGTRPGRRSFAGGMMDGPTRLFHVHFDGADGKCQIQALLLEACRILRTWRQPFL